MVAGKKEFEKKLLIKRTINEMNKQIERLETQKQVYINTGKEAKKKGLTKQYELALSGLRLTLSHQKRVYEMKLNFEIASQMKDMALMTTEFLKGMGSLSRDMVKLTNDKAYYKVQQEFEKAMMCTEVQAEHMETFMNNTQSAFVGSTTSSESDKAELEALIGNQVVAEESTDDMIEKELELLKRRMAE